jgi:hypothetical protein
MRFSVRSLLFITAAAAGFCGLFLAVPDSVATLVLTMAMLVLLAAAVVLATIGPGKARLFGLAYAVAGSWLPLYFGLFSAFVLQSKEEIYKYVGVGVEAETVFGVKCVCAFQFTASIVAGIVAIVVGWLCLGGSRPEPLAVSIDPRAMAELYEILQGRMTTANGDGDLNHPTEGQSRTQLA